ncbi:uncharacterized protein LOC113367648 [Ctenocephalides felis]|uniref:uncharacterized protein LOC113367648 n=1 Tax=Ctenocephalides felis TaxID=7515 RepID=UPI000E6E2EC6|nr:uncharacterized protein LOC113367648 [Ctenocephalides felis]
MQFVTIVLFICAAAAGCHAAPGFLTDFLSNFNIFNNHTSNQISSISEDIQPFAKCSIQLKDFTYKQPVFLQGGKIWRQTAPTLNFTGKITLACPGGTNILTTTEDQISQASCSGAKLRYSGQTFAPGDVTCKTSVTGDVQTTRQTCAGGKGTWSIVGFDLRNGSFVELYKVCYNQSTGDAVYSHHKLAGKSIGFKQIEPNRPSFKSAGSAPGVSPAVAYKGNEQLEMFSKLLGKRQAKKFIELDKNKILARGHLAPDGDFSLVPHQFATYFYINVCPQWQVVNAGNWLKVETMVRQLSVSRQDDFEVYTGTYDILSLPDQNNNHQPLFLTENQKISVPKYLWKVVYNKRRQEGIALVTLNNPYEETKPDYLCKNICEDNNWIHDGFENLDKGFTYCCDVNDLRRKVDTVPSLGVKKVLKFEKK